MKKKPLKKKPLKKKLVKKKPVKKKIVKQRRPSLPKVLVILGRAVELKGDEFCWKWTKRENSVLCSNIAGTRLYISPMPKDAVKIEKPDKSVATAKKLFKRFTPKGSAGYTAAVGRVPEALQKRGLAVSIKYESDKFGKKELYIHDFEKRPRAWSNKATKPTVVVIEGGKISITSRGIEG